MKFDALIALIPGGFNGMVTDSDPFRSPQIQTVYGARLICPAVTPVQSLPAEDATKSLTQVRAIGDGRYLVFTKMLVFDLSGVSEQDNHLIGDAIELFLGKARVSTGQLMIHCQNLSAVSRAEIEDNWQPIGQGIQCPDGYRIEWMPELLEQAIPFARIDEIDVAERDSHFVSSGVYVDALAALRQSDWRRAIIFAAMAMEALAGEVADAAEEQVLQSPDGDARYRVLAIIGHEGNTRIDPVLRLLRTRNSFRTLLHEVPLYALGRSLKQQDSPLYNKALSTYKTRNKLVHRGHSDENDSILSLDMNGAGQAINVANRVFAWFGVRVPLLASWTR